MERFIYYGKKYGRDLLIVLLLLFCISLIIYKFYIKSDDEITSESIALLEPTQEKIDEEASDTKNDEDTEIYVDIKGAVKTPGVYKVSSKAIINDVVSLSGGFKSNAYRNGINLSKKVSNEMVIYVYTNSEVSAFKKEKTQEIKKVDESNQVCECPTYDITECIEDTKSVIETKPENSNSSTNTSSNSGNKETSQETNKETDKGLEEDNKTNTPEAESAKLININTASASELTSLNGIGESKALAIITYREEKGKFTDIKDIMNVSGIGEAAFAKIKDYITV